MRKPPRNRLQLSGQRFGRLVILAEAEMINGQRYWHCACDCGNTAKVRQLLLRAGKTKSCGCLHRELLSAQQKTHGQTGTPEYTAWINMRNRCYTPNNISYPYYGGRGIKICERWRDSFENFYADMGPRPSPKHSVDRTDSNGDYTPENCQWATVVEQRRNQRSNHLITRDGETLTVAGWAERMGLSRAVLDRRIRLGWDIERALTTPTKNAVDSARHA